MFKCRNTGLICKSCTDQHRSKQNTELNKNINGNSYSLNIEFQSVKLLKKYIETSVLEIKISPECCLADLCIKDVNCVNNKWLPIQLKSTTKAHDNIYSFGLAKNYINMVIIFICIEEEKFFTSIANDLRI
jgi:hypothetical protein